MDQHEKQFIKDLENEQVLQNLKVKQKIIDNQKKIKNTFELDILRRGQYNGK